MSLVWSVIPMFEMNPRLVASYCQIVGSMQAYVVDGKTWICSVAATLFYFPLTIHLTWGLSWHPTPILSCPSWTTPILTGLRCNTEFLAGLFMVGHGSLVHGYRDALWPWLGDRSSTCPNTSIGNSEWCPKVEYGTSRKTTLYEAYNPLLQSCPILHKIAPQTWNGSHTSCAGTLTGFILRPCM